MRAVAWVAVLMAVVGIAGSCSGGLRSLGVRIGLVPKSRQAVPVASNRLRVLVESARGSAVPGAVVRVFRGTDMEPLLVAETDRSGGIDLDLPPGVSGWAGLEIRGTMGALEGRGVVDGSGANFTRVFLPASFSMEGWVVGRKDGRRIPGMEVRNQTGSVLTGSDGHFRIGVTPGIQALDGAVHLELRGDGGRKKEAHVSCTSAKEPVTLFWDE